MHMAIYDAVGDKIIACKFKDYYKIMYDDRQRGQKDTMPAALFIPHACRRCFLCLSPRVAAWQLRIATLIRSYIIPTHTQDLYNTIQYIRPNERAQRYEVRKA